MPPIRRKRELCRRGDGRRPQRDAGGRQHLEPDRRHWRRAARRVPPAKQDAGGERDTRERRQRAGDIHPAPCGLWRCGDGRRRAVSGPPEGSREVGGALPSIVRILRQALSNDGLGERRRERLKRRHRRRLTLEDCRDQARWRLTLERFSRGEHFVEHAAERKQIRPRVGFAAFHLLGRHVLERPENRALARDRVRRGRGYRQAADRLSQWPQLRETEIEQLDATLRHHDVSGFEIAMHDAGQVCLVECLGDLDCHLQRVLELERPASQAVRERLAHEVFEHEVVGAALMAHVIQRADVLMLETGDGFGFPLEPGLEIRVGRGQDFDRNRAVKARVFRLVDLAHAPRPEWRLDEKPAESCAWCQRHGLMVAVLKRLTLSWPAVKPRTRTGRRERPPWKQRTRCRDYMGAGRCDQKSAAFRSSSIE